MRRAWRGIRNRVDRCDHAACHPGTHRLNRRRMLQASAGGAAWYTLLAETLARDRDGQQVRDAQRPRSVIVLWLQGGPSQLDTFDPQPGSKIAAVEPRGTSQDGVQIATGLERMADRMHRVALIRSVISREGDHERATYNAKTGYRPDPTLVHPSIGAVVCHQLRDRVDIPRHVSIIPGSWPGRGGYLGEQFDAFRIGDPGQPVPDVRAAVPELRFRRRVDDLMNVVEEEFTRGRLRSLDADKTLHMLTTRAAMRMMSSEQLAAFDLGDVPQAERLAYGDSAFGRGCLAAVRLIDAGVRCVEVTLPGWDSHANNAETQRRLVDTLDPAFAALLDELEHRDLLERTIVMCLGEFGRTPTINPLGGRDHWPHGFCVVLAGGGLQVGQVIGATSPDPPPPGPDKAAAQRVENPCTLADIHATVLDRLGIAFAKELQTPVGRPMRLCEGTPIAGLIR